MCFIYSAITYLRCRECNAVDFASGKTCRSLTLCNAGIGDFCPGGLEQLHGHWFQTKPSDDSCRNCDQGTQAEQQRTIEAFQQMRVTGGDAAWELQHENATAQDLATPDRNLNLSAESAQIMGPGSQDSGMPITASPFLQATCTYDTLMEYFGLPRTPHPQLQEGVDITAPNADDPPFPEMPLDPDFEEMLNTAAASAQPAL